MLAFQQNLKLQMIKRLTYISLLFILGCTKGELPESTYTGNGLGPLVMYDLTVDTTRLGASAYVPGSYSHDPQANNHPGYGFNPPGWLNLEYNKTYIWGKGSWNESLPAGTDVLLTALPALGMEFHEWSNGVTENPIIFKMNSDIDLTAVFKSITD
tara:strand:- start:295 stop:762 length:468 start_codon:yes stop_codon:yes gene_type:complete